MRSEQLVDLDELIIRCRDEQAREYITEAVACYKAGAFRSCIVAAWIAVVFDFVDKLRELALAGDKNAEARLADFDNVRKKEDLPGSLAFERKILSYAKDEFELISAVEFADLSRLQEDRNRCAHPSMNVAAEAYQPSGELARYHLRNVVFYLLQHPPVQGKAALEWLMRSVNSEYFPTDPRRALQSLSSGPLSRPRESLVRSFVIVLLKSLLADDLDPTKRFRYLAAVNAVRVMQRETTEKLLRSKLGELVAAVPDHRILGVLHLLAFVADLWQYLDRAAQTRLETYVSNLPAGEAVSGLFYALLIGPLRASCLQSLKRTDPEDMANLLGLGLSDIPHEVIDRVLCIYSESGSFASANSTATKLILPLITHFSPSDVKRIVEIAANNGQISGSFELPTLLKRIREVEIIQSDELVDLLTKYGLKGYLSDEEEVPF